MLGDPHFSSLLTPAFSEPPNTVTIHHKKPERYRKEEVTDRTIQNKIQDEYRSFQFFLDSALPSCPRLNIIPVLTTPRMEAIEADQSFISPWVAAACSKTGKLTHRV
jgi:hypothetical protein